MGKVLLKTYIVSWYGPFHCIEEMEEWQRQNADIDCRLYLVQGKKLNAKSYSYYCGQTIRTVFQRFKDKNHPINEIPNRRSIWVGAFENRHNKEDIDIAENMFIYLLSCGIKEKQCLNRQSLYFFQQDYNALFISKWHNPRLNRQPECSIKHLLPEVVAYFAETDEVKIAQKLHSI